MSPVSRGGFLPGSVSAELQRIRSKLGRQEYRRVDLMIGRHQLKGAWIDGMSKVEEKRFWLSATRIGNTRIQYSGHTVGVVYAVYSEYAFVAHLLAALATSMSMVIDSLPTHMDDYLVLEQGDCTYYVIVCTYIVHRSTLKPSRHIVVEIFDRRSSQGRRPLVTISIV